MATYTLTLGMDVLNGGSGNDIFIVKLPADLSSSDLTPKREGDVGFFLK